MAEAVRLSPRFARHLRKKPRPMQTAIDNCVQQLLIDHRHPGLRTKPVQGSPGVFEARIDRGNRLTFEWDGAVIVLRANCNHDILAHP